jgi:enediyne biosynthesis protein E4
MRRESACSRENDEVVHDVVQRGWRGLAIGGVAACVVALASGRAGAFTYTFSDQTTAAGITHNAIPPGGQQAPTFPQVQSGGAAVGDFDGDGWPDLYVTRYFDSDILYHNNHDGTFTDVTSTAFPSGLGATSTNGAAWGDIDNDGDLDLYVTGLDENRNYLYINDGSGHFTEQAVSRGAGVGDGSRPMTGTSVSMGDYDNDGYLDMYVTEWDDPVGNVNPTHARLLHNMGAADPGHFEDVTTAAGVSMDLTTGPHAGQAQSFTPRFVDLDHDGYQDIAVVSDLHTTRLFWNNGDGTFTDGTTSVLTTGTDDMGFTVGDVNGDGLLDWFASSIYEPTTNPTGNHLYLNNGDRTFTDVTTAAGVRNGSWGWGSDMLDFNNDGSLDIVQTNGFTIGASFLNDRTRLFVNDGTGAFTEAGIINGIQDIGQGRGLVTFDYNNDGKMDIFIVNYDSAPILYRNDETNGNDWLNVKTVGTVSNTEGIGAWVTVIPDLNNPDQKMVWQIDGSSNYLSQSDTMAHFGLGSGLSTVDLVLVEWPVTGLVQQFTNVSVDTLLTAVELPGDTNNDGAVNLADLNNVKNNFGAAGLPLMGDLNGDGVVNLADLNMVKNYFGATAAVSGFAAVPEPVSGLLWGLAAAGVLLRRRSAA